MKNIKKILFFSIIVVILITGFSLIWIRTHYVLNERQAKRDFVIWYENAMYDKDEAVWRPLYFYKNDWGYYKGERVYCIEIRDADTFRRCCEMGIGSKGTIFNLTSGYDPAAEILGKKWEYKKWKHDQTRTPTTEPYYDSSYYWDGKSTWEYEQFEPDRHSLLFLLSGCGADKKDPGTDIKKTAKYLSKKYHLPKRERTKVILDCDMTFLGDDAMCLSLLTQADSIGLIELMGVSITGGNNFVAYGTNAALLQLESFDRRDIPVYMGTDIPIAGIRDMEKQNKIVNKSDKYGAIYHFDNYIEPDEYHDLKNLYERKWGYSETEAQTQSAVDFLIETVNENAGEVVIISTGPATNIAEACLQDPDFASKTAGIIYMGTVINETGSCTEYSDFNCFYDADSYHICFNSDFPSQTVISHDASVSAKLNKAVFTLLVYKNKTSVSEFWIDNKYSEFERNPKASAACSDAIAAVVFLNPSVIEDSQVLKLDVNCDAESPEYGRTLIGEGREDITVILSVKENLYWDFATDILSLSKEERDKSYDDFR